jgi:predicted Rdx family selenoprotein
VEEEIQRAFSDTAIQLIEGSGGIFEVVLNGRIIFSKLGLIGTDRERFPDEGEITALLHG